jgi:hypothetical protein
MWEDRGIVVGQNSQGWPFASSWSGRVVRSTALLLSYVVIGTNKDNIKL